MTVIGSPIVLAEHGEYAAARADVDTLSGRGFPSEHLAIVGTDLRVQEWIAGGHSRLGATARGAARGALLGALLAVLALLADASALAAIAAAVLLGASGCAVAARRRNGTSPGVTAVRHQVVVSRGWADDARLLLDRKPATEPTNAALTYRKGEIRMNRHVQDRPSAHGDGA